jgi:hypothetical protein
MSAVLGPSPALIGMNMDLFEFVDFDKMAED